MINRSASFLVRSNPIHRVFAGQPHECGHYERRVDTSKLAWWLVYFLVCTPACVADDFLGRASCSTSTCHGGVIDQGPDWNHSLSTWVARDPHAGAGLLLRDKDSRSIVVRLDPQAADSAETFDTVLRQRCISCHTTTTPEECSTSGLLDDAILAEGVSCESCHGAAGDWIEPHLRINWTGPKRFGSQSGMTDTESIIGRAESCVRCHIGSRTEDGLIRDMNHDLIAAGHPALRFDLLIYNENLPAHWATNSQIETQFNESAVRVRKVGRAINLAAAASLSSQRASDHLKDRSVPWPELADYDCFACHQSLSMDEFRLPPTGKTKSPLHISDGLPIWNAWHTLNQLNLEAKRSTLEALSPHLSDPERIASQCQQLAAGFRNVAAVGMREECDARDSLKSPMTQLQAEPPVDWHHAAIQYLEIDAALRDLATSADTAVTGSQFLESLRRCEPLLRFGTIQTSDGLAEYHSPATFDAEEFRSAVLRLFKVAPLKKVARPILNTPDSGTSIGSPPYSSPRTVHPAPQTDHDHPGAL